uniref:Uncharacterized protein n=1 Tax=Oxyrrhis marina TaxID=2969 RepID=A0A7S4GQK0_OXYMA
MGNAMVDAGVAVCSPECIHTVQSHVEVIPLPCNDQSKHVLTEIKVKLTKQKAEDKRQRRKSLTRTMSTAEPEDSPTLAVPTMAPRTMSTAEPEDSPTLAVPTMAPRTMSSIGRTKSLQAPIQMQRTLSAIGRTRSRQSESSPDFSTAMSNRRSSKGSIASWAESRRGSKASLSGSDWMTTPTSELRKWDLVRHKFWSGELLGKKLHKMCFVELAAQAKRVQEELVTACMRGDLRKATRAVEHGANVSAPNARGVTPVMLASTAVGKSAQEALILLLDKGAEINAQAANGWNALLHACRSGKLQAVELLLDRGAQVSALSVDKQSCLVMAILEGSLELVQFLFERHPSAATALLGTPDTNGQTPIFHAARVGKADIVKFLLEKGASANDKDSQGRRPLMMACEAGKQKVAKLLTAQPKVNVNAMDSRHFSSLMYACAGGWEELAMWLLTEKNADPSLVAVSGETAASLGQKLGLKKFLGACKRHARALEG